ncbi:hypothetical protein [Streptomyces phytophilus]|uniref:hypothetical protein n=1 Tax=Streptomyces phytophilus TaxID=722715 RepID=UPI0015EFFB4F|nr:hypothetical protein [Streptomyces phytophilus]
MGWARRAGAWGARGAALVGLLALPLVCVAEVAAVVWLHHAVPAVVFLLLVVPVGFLLLLLVLVLVVVLMHVMDPDKATPGGAGVVGAIALVALYYFALPGADGWMLRLQGTETTCTVLRVETRWESGVWISDTDLGGDPHDGMVATHHHDLACPGDGPAELTSRTEDPFAVGERVAVVYDPSARWGSWGVAPAESLELDGRDEWVGVSVTFGGVSAAVWALTVLVCAGAAVRAARRSRRAAGNRAVPADRPAGSDRA